MEWLQKIYILILNPFCGLSESISPGIRKAAVYIICFLLYATCYCWYSIIGMGTQLTLLSRMLESIVLIIILIFLGLEKPLKPVKWNKPFIYCWFALGMLILIMGFFNEQNTGYWMTGPVIALGLPCFYMVYGKREKYELIFDAICKSAMIISIIYFFVCLYGEYISDNIWDATGRYNGLTIDANKIGELCLASFCVIVYYMLVGKQKIWKIISVISLGIIVGQTYLTQSRTTILAMLFITAFYLIIAFKDAIVERDAGRLARRIGMLVIPVIIAAAAVNAINFVHENYVAEAQAAQEPASEEAASTETETVATSTAAAGAAEETRAEYRDLVPEKGADLNSFSSGRLFIWQTYADGFNFIGNPSDAETPISPLIKQRTAHNSLVEITYRSGYITGAVYLIIVILTGIYILKVMFRSNRKNTDNDYFMAIISIGYLIFTSLMSSFNPLTAIIFLLYALGLPVILEKKEKIRSEDG